MNYQAVAAGAVCSIWMWTAAGAPETVSASPAVTAPKSLADWIAELSDDRFRVREEATRQLWEMGEQALPALQAAAESKQPEQAYRARELVRKIELFITPETDPSVIQLVERFAKASFQEKQGLLDKMQEKHAWRQILKLYAAETNPELQSGYFQNLADRVALIAARESLIKGDAEEAREFLEMAPADSAGLLALADFHRSQGTLDVELKRALTLDGPKAAAWQLALYRVSGNREAAKRAADEADEPTISMAMSLLMGDPVPWLNQAPITEGAPRPYKPYTEIAIKRWQGIPLRASDWEPLERAAASRNESERARGINALFLLGETRRGEGFLVKDSPKVAFTYFDSAEMIPEALAAVGLAKSNPDFTGWVKQRMGRLRQDDDAADVSAASEELILMANFMERRGLLQECEEAFKAPLLALAEDHEETFTDFLGSLFGGQKIGGGAPELGQAVATAWVGENAERWDDLIPLAFGEMDDAAGLWNWLEEVDPAASPAARFEGMLTLTGKIHDPRHLREKWLGLAWQRLEKTPENRREPVIVKLMLLTQLFPDLANSRKLWGMAGEKDNLQSHWLELPAAGLWNEAAQFFLEQADPKAGSNPAARIALHAYAASCLRRAGRHQEAAVQDERVDKLALGNDAFEIGKGYLYGLDFKRAGEWFGHAAMQTDPRDPDFLTVLAIHGNFLMEAGDWKSAASVNEVNVQKEAFSDAGLEDLTENLVYRLQADLGRALTNLPQDRPGAIALLANCHAMCTSSGALADYFFPAVREAGLIREHDEWFRSSWGVLEAVVKHYPESENTYNTAGWLASRARRNLVQAREFQEKALAMNPTESSYLDTMAEIHFANGQRAKALEWSARALNFTPDSQVLLRQYEHFLKDPLPK